MCFAERTSPSRSQACGQKHTSSQFQISALTLTSLHKTSYRMISLSLFHSVLFSLLCSENTLITSFPGPSSLLYSHLQLILSLFSKLSFFCQRYSLFFIFSTFMGVLKTFAFSFCCFSIWHSLF